MFFYFIFDTLDTFG